MGRETPQVNAITVPSGQYVSSRVEDDTITFPGATRTRGPGAAYGILGDCSRFVGNTLPTQVQPREFIDRLGPADLIAFMTVGNGIEKLLDWTPKTQAAGLAPTSYTSASMVYQPSGPTEPLTQLFADPKCQGLERIAVIIGDLNPPNSEGQHVLACATDLAAMGVRVYVAVLDSGNEIPEVREVCERSGGAMIPTENVSVIADTLKQIQEQVAPTVVTTYRLVVTFESKNVYRLRDSIKLDLDGEAKTFTITSVP